MAGPDSANKFLAAELPASPAADDADDLVLTEHVAEIRRRAKEAIIEIGRRLADAKKRVGHGRWLKWLEHNLGWTDKSAQRFINVYEFSQSEIFKYDKLSNLTLPISAIYLLAQPSTPSETCAEIVERTRAGETPPIAEVQRTIDTAKGPPRNMTRGTIHPTLKLGAPAMAKRKPKPELVLVHSRDDICPADNNENKDARIKGLEAENFRLRSELREAKATRLLDRLDPLTWWTATPQEREHYLAGIGRSEIFAAIPKSWNFAYHMYALANETFIAEFKCRLSTKLWRKHGSTLKVIIAALGSPGSAHWPDDGSHGRAIAKLKSNTRGASDA